MRDSWPRLRDHRPLVLVSAGLSALEAVLIVTLGPPSAVALAPQGAAPAPFGVFHDLRWLLVFHRSWLAFVVELVLLVMWRTLVDTALTRAAWPRDVTRPLWRDHVMGTARFTVACVLALVLFAVLMFAMGITSLSWLFYVGVPVLVMVAVLVHPGSVDSRWWWNGPTRRSVAGTLLTFGVLSVAGGVLADVAAWIAPLLAAGAGVAVAWCRLGIVAELSRRSPRSRRVPFAIVGLAGVLAIVVGGTAIGFAVSVSVEAGRTATPVARADSGGPPVLIVKGFNSEWDGITRQWVAGDYRIQRFSYRGLDASGAPRPYERGDTHQSVRILARAMRDQVAALYRATGREVAIVAESEGALIAQTYLDATPNAPVRAAVLLSPLLEPGRVSYPDHGANGSGVVAGTVMDGIAAVLSTLGPVDVSADTALFRSIIDEGPAMRSLLRCPAPGVRELAVLPVDSGLSAPPPLDLRMPYAVVPALHGGLLGDGAAVELIGKVLRGRTATGSSFWEFVGDVMASAGGAWQVPTLQSSDGCPTLRRELRDWVGEPGS